ncbi:hypothetical protein LX36DRAFT_320336 [Colletotrichum falcatum]|nr:hypothetical protein LX36DRAFT_320336 [Colletotrichum falcatum]
MMTGAARRRRRLAAVQQETCHGRCQATRWTRRTRQHERGYLDTYHFIHLPSYLAVTFFTSGSRRCSQELGSVWSEGKGEYPYILRSRDSSVGIEVQNARVRTMTGGGIQVAWAGRRREKDPSIPTSSSSRSSLVSCQMRRHSVRSIRTSQSSGSWSDGPAIWYVYRYASHMRFSYFPPSFPVVCRTRDIPAPTPTVGQTI